MSILILRHSAENSLGDLAPVLDAHGLKHRYWDVSAMKPDEIKLPDETNGLIVLGGMMNADHEQKHAFLAPEKQLIREAVEKAKIPVLGICLGAQLLARALGAKVFKNPVKEIGWTPITLTPEGLADPVLSKLGQGTPQFQWHEDTFELPAGATLLAETPDCPRQAFRVNDQTYGVQFHPEVNLATIQEWLGISRSLPENRGKAIWEESRTHYAERLAQSRTMFEAFLSRAFGTRPVAAATSLSHE